MTRTEQRKTNAQDELHARIRVLEQLKANDRGFMQRVHDLRGLAAAHGFTAVVDIVDGLKRELDTSGRAAVVGTYVDRLKDALACGGDAGPVEAMMASVRARFC